MAKKSPTIDGVIGKGTEADPTADTVRPSDDEIVTALNSYRLEADQDRKSGMNPRDDKWTANLNLYWNRWDFSKKATWQAQEAMPEVPCFVDRFAAAMTDALVSSPDGFYAVKDPSDKEGDLSRFIKKMLDAWLGMCGRNQNGYPLAFPAVFEEQVKLGALMNCAAVVTWKDDVPGGRVAIDAVDPRFVWLDKTFRNLYRCRRLEIDRHDLAAMAKMEDSSGKPIFNLPQLEALVSSVAMLDQAKKNELSGMGQSGKSSRAEITLDEYIATVLGPDGKAIKERGLYVVANERFLIRGPEENPFWHGRDWLVYAPMSHTPLSVYGRSYMEDLGSIATAFNDMTNLILDATFTSSMKAFSMVPGYLLNPAQATTGIHPNKVFLLEDGVKPDDFAKALELGNLPPEAIQMWQMMKNELREASGMNEVATGQFAPKGRTSAQEVRQVSQSSSALIRSVASSLETRLLDPMLDLAWKTGVQHVSANDAAMQNIVGEELWPQLMANRRELVSRPITFQARGISQLIDRQNKLKAMLQMMQVIGSNQLLLQEFLKEADLNKLLKVLMDLSGIPMESFSLSERDKMIRQVAAPLQQAQAAAQGKPSAGGQAQREMASAAADMGVANG